MNKISLIADSGIQVVSFDFTPDISEQEEDLSFYEYRTQEDGTWRIELMSEVKSKEGGAKYFRFAELNDAGFFADSQPFTAEDVEEEGISPIDPGSDEHKGQVYRSKLQDFIELLPKYANRWLPIPYLKRQGFRYEAGSYNWSRCKITPPKTKGEPYRVILAFDTYTTEEDSDNKENPYFSDDATSSLSMKLCDDPVELMDYVSPDNDLSINVDDYLFSLAHPGVQSPERLRDRKKKAYLTAYLAFVYQVSRQGLFPEVELYRSHGVPSKDVDLIVDIGNSRTTAVLVEDRGIIDQSSLLSLLDLTALDDPEDPHISYSSDPFAMRLVTRKVSFGGIGRKNSRRFIYPSIVRLGAEAERLLHMAKSEGQEESLITLSSPKRYLWDDRRSQKEWRFSILSSDVDQDDILYLPGISEHIESDGTVIREGNRVGGETYYYSRRTMMSLAFLEILEQAQMYTNSIPYREDHGEEEKPRVLRQLIVTCPTAMSRPEREALVHCAEDANYLFTRFHGHESDIEVHPQLSRDPDESPRWYYDEATCAQLVYMYSEIGRKYNGHCEEFFDIYARPKEGGEQPTLTVASLDIGAGTTDLMICRYSYRAGKVTELIPEPLFYDSYYFAGDDMVYNLVNNLLFNSNESAFRKKLSDLEEQDYRQKLLNFFGPNYAGQTVSQRNLRRDFNLQYIVPLMYHLLALLSEEERDCNVRYSDLFPTSEEEPNESVLRGFEVYFGFPLWELSWDFSRQKVYDIVSNFFDPLLKMIADVVDSTGCDLLLLSGRPASLAPIRDTFLKYYPLTPNRLILLNNYNVGHWYPFGSNTGYITNPKTIVAVGGLLGFYASELGGLEGFVLDTKLLGAKLTSVVNYVEQPGYTNGQKGRYVLTPTHHSDELVVSDLPKALFVKQLDVDIYPSRPLFTINFDRSRIASRIRRNDPTLSDMRILQMVDARVSALERRLPFSIRVQRDSSDLDTIELESVRNRDNEDIPVEELTISIRSLGLEEGYWLDTGIFKL